MHQGGGHERRRAVLDQANPHAATVDRHDLCIEGVLILRGRGQVAHVEPIFHVALGHAVQAAALGELLGELLAGFCRSLLALQHALDQAVVDHIAILTNRRGPGGVGGQPQAEVRARLGRHAGEALETAQARIQPSVVAALKRTLQLFIVGKLGERFLSHFDVLSRQELLCRFGFFRLESAVHVEDAVADMASQEIRAAGVGSNHRLFDHAVGNAAVFGMNPQHVARFIQIKHVIRTIFKYQRVLVTPRGTGFGQLTQGV